jgi:polyisoprenoid-binding protein YceI
VAAAKEGLMRRSILLALALAAAPAAADQCRSVEATAGKVSFQVVQAGALFRGDFRRFGGEVCLAQGSVTRIDVSLEPASVDTGLPELDVALKDDEFFAVKKYPRIAFTSDSIDARGDRQMAHGTLAIKGKRRKLDVRFQLQEQGGKPVVSGTLTLNRLDYDIGTGEWSNTKWLGAEVKVDFGATLSDR